MKFIDDARMTVSAGRGGNGCMSFRREKFLPNGGPDGGNGGRGGSVVLVATNDVQTLADIEHRRRFSAPNGEHGKGSAKNGRCGEDLLVRVPCGTIVLDAETGDGLADLVEPGDRYVAAIGGRGGRGNRVFASSERRAPRFSEKGELGEERALRLQLKLIADIGIIGLPNAGKSSLLAALSNAQPKIADYPFTTLSPNLGVLRTDEESIVIADIPGLIEGASEDRGLGLRFLRHIERTRLLIHVVDISSGDLDQIIKDHRTVADEMAIYDIDLSARPCFVVGNKIDELSDRRSLATLAQSLSASFAERGMQFVCVSAYTGEGTDELTDLIVDFSRDHPRPHSSVRLYASAEDDDAPVVAPTRRKRSQIQIVPQPDGSFRVLHSQLENAADRYDLSQEENVARFTKLLRKYRVEDLLEAAGADHGALVSIGHMEFNFYPDEMMR